MNKLSKSFIILFSELIWIYYAIALFSMRESETVLFVNFTWWIVAAVFGYVLNIFIAGRMHYVSLIVINCFVFSVIVIQNWRLVVPEGSFIFGIIISAVIAFIFLRSANLAFKQQTRRQMLYRFEGNIIFYVIFAFMFTENEMFHAAFLFAIFISLMGMVLTLQNHVKDENQTNIEVHKVGRSGWFTGIIGVLLGCIALASFLLFLPSVRHALQSLGTTGWSGLQWIYNQAVALLMWLFNLLPAIEMGEGMEEGLNGPIPSEEISEESMLSIPPGWLIAGAILLIIIVVSIIIWIASRFLKQWEPPRHSKAQRLFMFDGSWWKQLIKSFITFLKRIQMIWRVKFPRYYNKKIYWYYYKVQQWAKKNGINQLLSETSKEYIEKIIDCLNNQTSESLSGSEREQLISSLRKLNQAYQSTYYGYEDESSELEYRQLLQQLKTLKINKRFTKGKLQNILKNLSLKRA